MKQRSAISKNYKNKIAMHAEAVLAMTGGGIAPHIEAVLAMTTLFVIAKASA